MVPAADTSAQYASQPICDDGGAGPQPGGRCQPGAGHAGAHGADAMVQAYHAAPPWTWPEPWPGAHAYDQLAAAGHDMRPGFAPWPAPGWAHGAGDATAPAGPATAHEGSAAAGEGEPPVPGVSGTAEAGAAQAGGGMAADGDALCLLSGYASESDDGG